MCLNRPRKRWSPNRPLKEEGSRRQLPESNAGDGSGCARSREQEDLRPRRKCIHWLHLLDAHVGVKVSRSSQRFAGRCAVARTVSWGILCQPWKGWPFFRIEDDDSDHEPSGRTLPPEVGGRGEVL